MRPCLRCSDVPRLAHGLQHLGATLKRRRRVVVRVVRRGQLGQAREQRRLRQRQVLRRLGEVRLCSGLDAVRVVAVEDGVEIRRQDLVFGEAILELDREDRLAQLPVEGVLLDDVNLRDQLLRQRRAALHDVSGHDVLDDGAGNALRVDTPVLVEATVLDRDGALLHPRRDLAAGDRLTILVVGEHTEGGTARVVDLTVGADLTRFDGVECGQVVDIPRRAVEQQPSGDRRHECEHHQRAGKRPPWPLLLRRARRAARGGLSHGDSPAKAR